MESPDPSLRYAVLWHTGAAAPHFDLLVETAPGSSLATWRSPVWPIEQPTRLTRLKDHRRIYLEFEGELSDPQQRVDRIAGGLCKITIGENAVWTIELLTGSYPITLQLSHVDADQWEAE